MIYAKCVKKILFFDIRPMYKVLIIGKGLGNESSFLPQ